MNDDGQLREWLGGHRDAMTGDVSRAEAMRVSASDHPDIDVLARHASGQLSPEKARAVHAHLLACDDGRCVAFVRANAEDIDAAADQLYPGRRAPDDRNDISKATEGGPIHAHTFQCREGLWETFEQMARELDIPVDDLVTTAMQAYAEHRASLPPPRLPDTGAHDYSVASEGAADLARTMARDESYSEAAAPMPRPMAGRPPMDLPTLEGPAARASVAHAPPPTPPPGLSPSQRPTPPPLHASSPPPGSPLAKHQTMRMSTAPTPPPAMTPAPLPLGLSPSAPGMPPPPPPPPGGMRRGGPSVPAMPAARSVPPPPPSSGGMRAGGRSAPPPLPSAPAVIAQAFAVGPTPSGEQLTLTYQGRPMQVDKDRVVLGRSKQNADVVLDDANVSRQHAAIERVGHAWYVVDLGSTNGVYVGGVRITRHRLIDGDLIEITTHQVAVSLR